MMKPFATAPHTADVRLKVTGRNLVEIFTNGLSGLDTLLKKDFCQKTKKYEVVEKISIRSADTTLLLIDFLSEVLTLSSIKKVIFCIIYFLKFKASKISVIV